MQEANKMQRQMQQAQKELEETLFEVESSGGAIKISIYGNYHVEKIDIDEDLIKDADKASFIATKSISSNISLSACLPV